MISYDDFKKLEFKIGEIVEAHDVPGSTNLLRLIVDLGTEKRQLVAGIAKGYKKEELIGKQIVILTNLEPKIIWGVESNGMLLAAVEPSGTISLVVTDKKLAAGAPVL